VNERGPQSLTKCCKHFRGDDSSQQFSAFASGRYRRGGFALYGALILAVFSASCRKKPDAAQLRAATYDLVAAAQKFAAKTSSVAIRPQMQSGPPGTHSRILTDHIYVTLAEAGQRDALEQALDAVAGNYHLTRNAASSTSEWSYESDGRPTHVIHVLVPVPAAPPEVKSNAPAGAGPRLAIIIDDMGHDRATSEDLFSLKFPLTVSVLPNLPYSAPVAEEAHRRGDQVLLHLPMESEGGADPEPQELRTGMPATEVEHMLDDMLGSVPYAAGVNNHQGSRATADAQLMAELMPALRQRNLFFIDSRTSAATVAYNIAERDKVRAGYRKVFLDDVPTHDAVLKQLALAERDARRDGWAIAIGHPHPETLAALREGLAQVQKRGIRLVFASDLAR
jgi:uncharacterized protein